MSHTVMVTGASGYIAGWIVKDLLEAGHTVHATVRSDGAETALKRAPDRASPPRSTDGGRTLPPLRFCFICVPVHIDRPVLTVCSVGTSYRMQKGLLVRSRSGRIFSEIATLKALM